MNNPPGLLVYAARHGTTQLNTKNAFRGPLEIPLDDSGVRDAENLARWFSKRPVGVIFTSDRQRTMQTAHIIAHSMPGVEMHPASALRAWDVGEYAGKSKDRYEDEFKKLYIPNPDMQVPGGESLNQFRGRVHPVFLHAAALAKRIGKPVLMVTHSSVIHEMGNMFNGNHESATVDPGGVAGLVQNSPIKAVALYKAREDGKRVSAQSVDYMELPGAVKDADCSHVAVRGGVSSHLGCCNDFEWATGTPKQFRCGTCEYFRPKKS